LTNGPPSLFSFDAALAGPWLGQETRVTTRDRPTGLSQPNKAHTTCTQPPPLLFESDSEDDTDDNTHESQEHTQPSNGDPLDDSLTFSLDPDDTSISSQSTHKSIASDGTPPPPRHTKATLSTEWQAFFDQSFSAPENNATITPRTPLPPSVFPPKNDRYGDPFTKDHNNTRIWFNNINTLSATNDFEELHELCTELLEYDVGIIALQEPNVDFTQYRLRDQCLKILHEHFGMVHMVTSSSSIRAPNAWKPGGTLLAVVGKSCSRVLSSGSDELGRWTWITMQGSNNKSITVYNVYNVCKTTIGRAGAATAFAQQWHLLRLAGDKDPNPRKQCITDFNFMLQEHQKSQGKTIIVGDLNEELGVDLSGFATSCAKFDLADVHEHFHPDTSDLVTYIRGSRRVDYAMVSHELLPWIKNNGFNPFNLIHSSDHRAGFLDLDLSGALGPDPPPLVKASL
jgi:endonuclease/exonuclease/phosphatase family metal-dependent hydrolase